MIEKKRGTERIFVLSKLERITDSCMIKVKALSRKKQKLIKGQDMESFATDVAKSTLDKLVDATIVQSRYICCFTRIVDDFEKEKEALQAKRETVKEYVQLANRRDENIRSDVTFWQEQADKLIEEDTKTKVTCFFGWCPNCKWRHSRGKELAHNTEEIKRLIKEVAENNFRSAGIPRSVAGVEYHSSKDYIPFKSRELKCKELSEALKDDNNCITGLQGMGGAGKTTLAKEVGKELEKSNKFDRVIVTVVSNTPDIKKIQDDIAAPLGLTESLTKCNESERARRLWSRLTKGEKILIILDDVWEVISFEDIGIPNRDNRNGCRILITSRNLRTCRSMQCDKTIELELLSKEDAWMLFKNHAGLSDRSSKSILDKGRKIAKECKGLPIAIAVIASSLKGEQRQEEWDVALKSLQKPNPTDDDDENLGKIYKCLRYSYDNMKNEKAKQLFLLCSVFREDEEIEVETLTTLSIAVGLVGEIDESYDERRSQVAVIKNKLIDSCLLLKIDERRVKMHDLVREVALWIANEEVKAVNTSIEKDKSWVEKAKNLKYLLCEGKGMDVFSLGFDKSKLEILIVHMDEDDMDEDDTDGDDMDGDGNDSVEIPDSFFQNMIRLRVLYLSHKRTYPPRTLSLTQSIQSLTNIRYLYLNGFILGDIPILRNLKGLETLDLDQCSLDELPCEIAELAKLKLLRLDLCEIKRSNPFKVIECCSSLEELYFIFSFPKDRSTMHQKVELPKLRRFRIIEKSYNPQEKRNYLSVSKADGVFSEATFKHLVQTSDSIQLSGLEGGWRNLMPDIILPEDEGALNLTLLDLESISELECLIDAKHIGSRIQNVFCNLTQMILGNCPMLVTLFPLSTIQSLVLLEHLSIWNCEQLESIITDEKEKEDLREAEIVGGNNDNKSGGLLFPNLKTLDIRKCPKLEFVLPGVAGRDVPKLEYIKICDCVELKYIFGPCQHQQEEKDLHQELKKDVIFATLKSMVLEDLPNFVGIFWKYDQYRCSSVKRSCSKDESKTEIESCDCEQLESIITDEKEKEDLREAEIVGGNNDNKSGGLLFPNLKSLRIERCRKLEFVLRGVAGRDVPKLEDIEIRDCFELKYIFGPYQHQQEEKNLHRELKDLQEEEIVDGNNDNKSGGLLFPNLKTLCIESCPKLEFGLPGVAGRDVPKLEEIQVCDCVELKYIFGPYQHQQEEKNLHRELKDVIFATLKSMVLEGLPNLVDIFWKYDQYRCSSVKRSCSKDESKTEIESCVKRWCSKDGFKCNIYPWSSKYRHKLRTAKFPLDSDDQLQDCTLSSIIDGDTMNQRMSFLPRLQVLVIKQCNNIKCVFPFPTSKMPPKLKVLAIIEASMLEEVFRWESDKKVEISDVKVAIFVELPSFNQGNEFHTIKDCLVHNCPKLSLNSTSTPERIQQIKSAIEKESYDYTIEYILKKTLGDLYKDSSNQTPTTKATEDSPTKTKVQASSENELSSSQLNTSQSIHSNIVEDNQHVTGIESNEFISTEKQTKETLEIELESDEKLPGLDIQSIATSPANSELIGKPCRSPSELDIPLNESHSLEDQNTQEESMSEKTPKTTFSTHPKMEKISSRPLVSPPQKEVKRNVEEGTTSVYGKTIASPIDLGSENCEGQIAKPSFSTVNVKPTTIKDDDDGDHAQETSKSVITHIMTNAPENLPQITKDSNFISIIRRELEQLVSNKHLAFENLELLINFLVKKPSVHLTNNALSDRYKGFAYTCLVELLIFLQTHSVLDVLESNHSEFVGLLQDVRRFGFDKNWLDDVERRALFPCLPSSENTLKNLLDSKHTLIQHLEDMKHQLEESIIQQETQVLKVKATFSTPLGY